MFYLVQKTQKKRIEQKYANERELTKLQIQTIKNQSDPHFIFNALNAISSSILKEDKIQISLEEEVEFIQNYLKLEKLRFKEKFNYKISINKHIDQKQNVPRMVIQSYIENAIKHGLMHKENNGLLEIAIKNSNKHLEIIIDDNGVGREKSKEFSGFSTGKGLQIMNRVYELYDKLHNVKITQTIEDKVDNDGNALGTRVRVKIPVKELKIKN